MDETPCWMDIPSDTTIATTGSCSILLKTSGHKKDHFTVILTAKADETKFKSFICVQRKRHSFNFRFTTNTRCSLLDSVLID